MPCYHPITGYRAKRPNPETGRFPIVFNHKDGWIDRKVNLPCGKCIGCKLEYSRQWAVRCTHEAQMHDRWCIGFAKTWGFGSLIMTNLFAWRATQPKDMLSTIDPVGPDNDDALNVVYAHTALTVAAWGVYGAHLGRDKVVRKMFPRLYYLQLTEDGHPKHPLYLPATLRPLEWDF